MTVVGAQDLHWNSGVLNPQFDHLMTSLLSFMLCLAAVGSRDHEVGMGEARIEGSVPAMPTSKPHQGWGGGMGVGTPALACSLTWAPLQLFSCNRGGSVR